MSDNLTPATQKRSWFTAFAAVIIVGGIALFASLVWRAQKSFPPLPVGAFVGQISTIAGSSGEFRTLYVERIPNSQALLIVVFTDGWKPQFVPMDRIYEKLASEKLTEDVPIQPVALQVGDYTATLSGKKDFNNYSGDVLISTGEKGIWNLRPVKPEELSSSLPDEPALTDLRNWLTAKSAFLQKRKQLKEATVRIEQNQEKLRKLEKFITQEDLLRNRAQERKKLLATELQEAEKGREDGIQRISSLVSELELLGRISKQGKAINLARKVAARENKWYLVNWGAAEDVAAIESEEAAAPTVDMAALDEEYRSAQEKRSLQRQLADEKKRIEELHAQLAGGAPPDASESDTAPTYDAKDEEQKGKKGNRNLWDRIWGE